MLYDKLFLSVRSKIVKYSMSKQHVLEIMSLQYISILNPKWEQYCIT